MEMEMVVLLQELSQVLVEADILILVLLTMVIFWLVVGYMCLRFQRFCGGLVDSRPWICICCWQGDPP